MDIVKEQLRELFERIGEDETHGYGHALKVLGHAEFGLAEYLSMKRLNTDQIMTVKYAALLHDADDTKIFGHSEGYPNATRILQKINFNLIDDVLDMINLVSFSTNGISTVYFSTSPYLDVRYPQIHASEQMVTESPHFRGTRHRIPIWKLIPRDSDRLEALGKIGVARCFAYGAQIGRQHFTSSTPRVQNYFQLIALASQNWLSGRIGNSTIDYFIAGLIPRTFMSSGLDYFQTESQSRVDPIVNICLLYGQTGTLTKAHILDCVSGDYSAEILVDKYLR